MNLTRAAMSVAVLAVVSLALAQPDLPGIPNNPDPAMQADTPHQATGDEADSPRPVTGEEVEQAMSDLERDQQAMRRTLEAEYEERREELVDSPDYKAMSRRERKSRMRALKNELRVRERQLEDDFRSKREDFKRQAP